MYFNAYTKLSTDYPLIIRRVIRLFRIATISLSVLLSACVSDPSPAPISNRYSPSSQVVETHIVRRGETLYSIAWQYNLDYKELARGNNIGAHYQIFPGQRINLRPSTKPQSAVRTMASAPKKPVTKPIVTKPQRSPIPSDKVSLNTQKRSNKAPPAKTSKTPSEPTNPSLSWQWPASGKVLTNFYSTGALGKGIDIAGKKGDSVFAATNGKVVYAGSGIRGYGNLVIIRHNTSYLSAYAHNHSIRVKEGDLVVKGQHIADLGSTGTGARNKTILHFQVRKNGKPIDPLKVLPKRNS